MLKHNKKAFFTFTWRTDCNASFLLKRRKSCLHSELTVKFSICKHTPFKFDPNLNLWRWWLCRTPKTFSVCWFSAVQVMVGLWIICLLIFQNPVPRTPSRGGSDGRWNHRSVLMNFGKCLLLIIIIPPFLNYASLQREGQMLMPKGQAC